MKASANCGGLEMSQTDDLVDRIETRMRAHDERADEQDHRIAVLEEEKQMQEERAQALEKVVREQGRASEAQDALIKQQERVIQALLSALGAKLEETDGQARVAIGPGLVASDAILKSFPSAREITMREDMATSPFTSVSAANRYFPLPSATSNV